MRRSENRTPFRYGSIPHSVLELTNQLSNVTAAKLLMYLARRTFCFRKGSVVASYGAIARELGVCWRTVATAAKRLEDLGYVVRRKTAGQSYKWWVPLRADELVTPVESGDFLVMEMGGDATPKPTLTHDRSIISPMTDRSYPPMQDRSWDHTFERGKAKPDFALPESCGKTVDNDLLKKDLLKETYLKKQHSCGERDELAGEAPIGVEAPVCATSSKLAPRRGDDEPLFKFCLRELVRYGVSRRMARKLCREYDHDLVKQVLETVPELSGVENVAGYLVTAIRDGGYSCRGRAGAAAQDKSSPSPVQRDRGARQKNGHQVSGGRSTSRRRYGAERSLCESTLGDSPIVCRSVEETRLENERLERERVEREERYREQSRSLAQRFQALSDGVKAKLKALAEVRLEEMLPTSSKREEMKADPAFRKVANREVLVRFFAALDGGASVGLALGC